MNMTQRIAALGLTVAAPSLASAGLTTVNTAPSSGRSLLSIMNEMYTGDLSNAGGSIAGDVDLGFAGFARRIQDFSGTTAPGADLELDVGGAGVTDQNWLAGAGRIELLGRYSNGAHTLGVSVTSTGLPLALSDTADLVDVSQSDSVSDLSALFNWVLTTGSSSISSLQASNTSSTDRMVAFEINPGTAGVRGYLIAFDVDGDGAFNDVVIDIAVTIIPLPTSAALGMAGLSLLAIRRRGAR
jgi:hypothetical protein